MNLVERFQALVDNTITDDELAMAAWKVARQIDRLPKTTKPKPEPKPKPETQGAANRPEPAAAPEAAAATA